MSLSITLYKNLSDKKVLHKSLSDAINLTGCYAVNELDILHPVIRVESSTNLSDYNYLYIDYTARYYYFTDPVEVRTGIWEISCSVDVLMSHSTEILATTGTILRNENLRNGYLMDDRYQAKAYKQIVAKKFPNSIDNDTIILMTVG